MGVEVGFEKVKDLLEGKGFNVAVKKVKYKSITGGILEEERLIAFKEGTRLSISRIAGDWKLSLLAEGEWSEEDAEDLEMLGGLVEVEDDRIIAVFPRIPSDKVEYLIREILDSINA